MKCDQMRSLMGAYLNHELSHSERAWAEGHLRGCEACRGELDRLSLSGALAKTTLLMGAAAVEPSPYARRASRISSGFIQAISATVAAIVFVAVSLIVNAPKTALPMASIPADVSLALRQDLNDTLDSKAEWRRELNSARMSQTVIEQRNTWSKADDAAPIWDEPAAPPDPRICDECYHKMD
jgi:hypothetical protein